MEVRRAAGEFILETWMNPDFSQWRGSEWVTSETLNEMQMTIKMNGFSNYLILPLPALWTSDELKNFIFIISRHSTQADAVQVHAVHEISYRNIFNKAPQE